MDNLRRLRMLARPRCAHGCGRMASQARGLCNACFNDVGIRCLYPENSRFIKRHPPRAAGLTGARPLPGEPTVAMPGTPAKVKVLCERAMRGEHLWHPGDARWADADEVFLDLVCR